LSKAKAQGTAFEAYTVKSAEHNEVPAFRLAEGGSGDAGDVYLGKLPDTAKPITVLAWKRLVPTAGASRRRPDGEPVVFVLDETTFWRLASSYYLEYQLPFIIECKATERLNVTRTLAKAKDKVNKWWNLNRPVAGV